MHQRRALARYRCRPAISCHTRRTTITQSSDAATVQHAAPTRCEPRDGHGAGQSAGRGGCTVSSSTRQDHASCSEAAQRAAGAWDALLEPFQHHAGVAARTSSRSSQARRLKEHTTSECPARSTSDLHSRTQRSSARATRKVPRSGVGMDGRPMFLRVHSAYVHSQGRTLYTLEPTGNTKNAGLTRPCDSWTIRGRHLS